MMADVVLQAPKKHKRRHKYQHTPAGPQHTPHLSESGKIVVHVLDYVECSYEIEGSVVVRKLFTCAKLHVLQSALATERQRVFRNIDTFCVAVFRKHQQICTRPAADVENARTPVRHLA